MCCQPTEQLKFHPLRSPRATHNLTDHIRTRRKIAFENRLARFSHISKYGLAKMPSQKLLRWPILFVPQINMFPGYAMTIAPETHDLVIILRTISLKLHVIQYTYVWIDRDIVAVKKVMNSSVK